MKANCDRHKVAPRFTVKLELMGAPPGRDRREHRRASGLQILTAFGSRSLRCWATAPSGCWKGLCFVIRAFGFANPECAMGSDAYGSRVWAFRLLHTTDIIGDGIGTNVMTLFLFTHSIDEERFSDVDDDRPSWGFVVFAWAPIYLAIHCAPRWIA